MKARAKGLATTTVASAATITCLAATMMALAATGSVLHAQTAPSGFLEEFEGQFGASSSKLVALADAMPESTYDWSPGEGVASVARVFMHIARYNYMYPHENMGRDSPVPRAEYMRWEDEVTDKAEVVQILEESMEYVTSVYRPMSVEDTNREVTLYGRQVGEWAVLLQLLAHMNEHLGQSIAYARTNDVVPPWSR